MSVQKIIIETRQEAFFQEAKGCLGLRLIYISLYSVIFLCQLTYSDLRIFYLVNIRNITEILYMMCQYLVSVQCTKNKLKIKMVYIRAELNSD